MNVKDMAIVVSLAVIAIVAMFIMPADVAEKIAAPVVTGLIGALGGGIVGYNIAKNEKDGE